MVRLQFTTTEKNYELITELSCDLGVSRSDLINEAVFYFLVENGHDVEKRIKRRFALNEIKSKNHQRYMFSNAIGAIRKQTVLRCIVHGEPNHEMVINMVEQYEKLFGTFDDDVKREMVDDLKKLQELKTYPGLMRFFGESIPQISKEERRDK